MCGRDSKRPEITAWTAKRFHHWPVDQSKRPPDCLGRPSRDGASTGWAGSLARAYQCVRREGFTNHALWRVTQLVLVLRRTCTSLTRRAVVLYLSTGGGWEGTAVCGGGGCQYHPTASSLSVLVSGLAGSLGTGTGVLAGTVAFSASAACILLLILIYSTSSISYISSASSRSIILNLNPTLSQPRVWSLSLYFCL